MGVVAPSNGEVQYAGFWRRVSASIVDLIIFTVIFTFIISIINFFGVLDNTKYITSSHTEDYLPPEAEYIIQFIYSALTICFLISPWQATPGKYITGLYVVDKSNKKITIKRAFVRTLLIMVLVIVSDLFDPSKAENGLVGFGLQVMGLIYFFIILIWYGMAGVTKQKTALHDIIAGTRVIKGWPVPQS